MQNSPSSSPSSKPSKVITEILGAGIELSEENKKLLIEEMEGINYGDYDNINLPPSFPHRSKVYAVLEQNGFSCISNDSTDDYGLFEDSEPISESSKSPQTSTPWFLT